MHISRLAIENFKSLERVEFHLDQNLNVFTGANNSGKTTVLEAISLWAECFRKRIWQAGKADKQHRVKKGQYRLDYEAYLELQSVRSPNFEDIFYNLDKNQTISINVTLSGQDEEITIGFTIRAAQGSNYAVNLRDAARFPFDKFNAFFTKLPSPLNIVYASPVAALLPREDFETLPRVRSLVGSRQSMQVLRNRLYQLKKDPVRYEAFLSSVTYVLTEGAEPVELQLWGDETRDVGVTVQARVGARDVFKDISLLGSGTVQIIEIMLAVHAERSDLNVILLDEPDSHIHRDIQRRLVHKLTEHTGQTQVFLTTHNESFIRSTRPEHIFHLEPRQNKQYRPIYADTPSGVKRGLQPSRQLKILRALGSETSIDFLNALEAEHFVLVEGEDDARFIQAIVERGASPPTPFSAMYWSFGGVDAIFKRIDAYKEVFQHIKNDKSLWEKAKLVIDRDYLTDAQRSALEQELTKLGAKIYISTSYTMESTVLSEPDKLAQLIARLIQKEGGPAVPLADVQRAITQGVAGLKARLLQRVEDAVVLNELFNRTRARRDAIDAMKLNGKTLARTDAEIQTNFVAYAKANLDQDRPHLFANKDDVTSLIEGVYTALTVPFNANHLFERLIDASNPSTWFDEWGELRRAVLQR